MELIHKHWNCSFFFHPNTAAQNQAIYSHITCSVCTDILTFQCSNLSATCDVGETCKLQLSSGNTVSTHCEKVFIIQTGSIRQIMYLFHQQQKWYANKHCNILAIMHYFSYTLFALHVVCYITDWQMCNGWNIWQWKRNYNAMLLQW